MMLKESMSNVFLLIRYGFSLLSAHFFDAGSEDSEVDIVGAAV